MLVGFTGIRVNQTAIDTIGQNVANVNTTAFNSQRALFETLLHRTQHGGSSPDGDFGGTNPIQTGTGATVGAIQRNFAQGSLNQTGIPSDLAIDGQGFFIVQQPDGTQAYTRDGAFDVDSTNQLVTTSGALVQGFAADETGAIVEGSLSDLTIPFGLTIEPNATTEVQVGGQLDPDAGVASTSAVLLTQALQTSSGATAQDSTALTQLVDDADTPLFADGDRIVIEDIRRGELTVPSAEFIVGTDGSTLGDFAAFLTGALGINTAVDPEAGVTIAPAGDPNEGSLIITSNAGSPNAIAVDPAAIRNETSGVLPFEFTTETEASGDGTTTSFQVFDSLGEPVEVRLRFVQEARSDTGTTWRFYADAADGNGGITPAGSGTLSFNQNGRLVESTDTDLLIDRSASGAVNPLGFNLDFSEILGFSNGEGGSQVFMTNENGSPSGVMIDYAIGEDGVISATFSNDQTRVLGQVAVATFTNPEGLVARSDNVFVSGPNSGDVMILSPQAGGTGTIRAGTLEESNVELAREFIGLITASTGFSAAGRVIRTADDLLQELLLLAR
jgi:flagellar hook protein FlgE